MISKFLGKLRLVLVVTLLGMVSAAQGIDIVQAQQRLWSYSTGNDIRGLSISSNGSYIAAGSGNKVYLFDRVGTPLWSYTIGSTLLGVSVSSDGSYIAAGSDDYKIYFFNKEGRPLWNYDTHGFVYGVSVSSDGSYIAAGSGNRKIYFLNKEGILLWSYTIGSTLLGVSVSSDGSYIAAGSDDNKVYFFDREGRLLWSASTGDDTVSVSVSSDGSYIAAGSYDGKIHFFDKTGLRLWNYDANTTIKSSVSLSDGSYIAAGSGPELYFFDREGRLLWKYRFMKGSSIISVSVPPVGPYIGVGVNNILYFFRRDEKPGSITVNTNRPSAAFTITGPVTTTGPISYSGEGTSWNKSNVPVGTYRVTFNDIQCYTTPSSRSNVLEEGGSITFVGKYIVKQYAVSIFTLTTRLIQSSSSIQDCGNTVKITAPDIEGYTFSNWTEEGSLVSPNSSHQFIINKNYSLVAVYTALNTTTPLLTKPPENTPSPVDTKSPSQQPIGRPEPTQPISNESVLLAILGVVAVGAILLKTRQKPSETVSPAIPSTFPPELQADYTDVEFLGKGGFARVFKAKKKSDEKIVAVKVPLSLDETTGKSFLKEIKAWEELKHDNIAELYDMNIMPIPFLEMEYVDNKSLEEMKKPIEMEKAARIVFDIAEGLKYAHGRGMIHRDLKPQNILLTGDLTPKIADWGLSKVLAESKTSSIVAFTPLYASPEQVSSKQFGKPDARSDIYQLGVVFYELVTGRLPFEGDDATEVISQIISEEAVPPSSLNPETNGVEHIILRCLAKKREERYQNLDELQRDLAEYLRIEYKNSLKASEGNMKRSAYYCSELFLLHAKLGEISEALKYCLDMRNYAGEEIRGEVDALAKELEYRSKEGVQVGEEFLEKAKVIAHQAKMGWK